jgi:hypothetical protein
MMMKKTEVIAGSIHLLCERHGVEKSYIKSVKHLG